MLLAKDGIINKRRGNAVGVTISNPSAEPLTRGWYKQSNLSNFLYKKRLFEAGDATAIFIKNVTYLLHSMAFGMRVKRREGAEIGQTTGSGSDDF